jgi:predicted ATPase
MFNSVRLVNFFSFEDETIELSPNLNLLVGINASGKSNLLNAFRLLHDGLQPNGLSNLIRRVWGGFDEIAFAGSSQMQDTITLEFEFDYLTLNASTIKYYQFRQNVFYRIDVFNGAGSFYIEERLFTRSPGKEDFVFFVVAGNKAYVSERDVQAGKPRLKQFDFNDRELNLPLFFDNELYAPQAHILRFLQTHLRFYYRFNSSPESKIRKRNPDVGTKRLEPDGSNLAVVLNTLEVEDLQLFNKIEASLREVNPNFRSLKFSSDPEGRVLMIAENGFRRAIHASKLSDGTLHYLCLAVVFATAKPGDFICLDEPELGLHPDMYLELQNWIRANPGTVQYLLSTHSADLLDRFDVEELLVIDKDENGASFTRRFRAEDFADEDTLLPGQLWKRNLLGGNR